MESYPSSMSRRSRSDSPSSSLSPRRRVSGDVEEGVRVEKESRGGRSPRDGHMQSRSREGSLDRQDEGEGDRDNTASRWSFGDEDGKEGDEEDVAGLKEKYTSSLSLNATGTTRAAHRRQPPMTVETFYTPQTEEDDGGRAEKRNGFLDIYCKLNYLRTHERKFGTLNHADRRQEIEELEKDVKELKKRLLTEKKTRGEAPQQGWGAKSTKATEMQLALKTKRLASMKAKRCRDLRDDLNLLLRTLGDELGAIYPYNESLERMSQRLDQFSWKAPTWIAYRPLLLQTHKNGFYDKWVASGCPQPPHSLHMKQASREQRGGDTQEQRQPQEEDTMAEGGPEEPGLEGTSAGSRRRPGEGFEQCPSSSAGEFEPFLEEESLPGDWQYPPEEGNSWSAEGAALRVEEKAATASRKESAETSPGEGLSEEVLRIMEAKKRAAMAKREARLEKQRQAAAAGRQCD
ncbi:hypothetical protein CSUI_000965 [Cystoisospora suis]|uniref:Uncharacterized protein n=1 Tax=Cystoisospora suis TaxID=483139 RepID=A0A2C6LEH5_9APIC|nr:hypothetical protein CSUI_000965 [Cystoisospora suis]